MYACTSACLQTLGGERILRLRSSEDTAAHTGARASADGAAPAPAAAPAPPADLPAVTPAPAAGKPGSSKTPATAGPKGGAEKEGKVPAGKKVVPASFVEVVDSLIEVVIAGHAAIGTAKDAASKAAAATKAPAAMDLDTASPGGAKDQGASGGASEAAVTGSGGAAQKLMDALKSPEATLQYLSAYPAAQAAQAMALKCLTDFVLLFNPTVSLLLKRDHEMWVKEHHVASHPPKTPGPPTTSSKAAKEREKSEREAAAAAAITPATGHRAGHRGTAGATPATGHGKEKEARERGEHKEREKDTAAKDKEGGGKDKEAAPPKAGTLLKVLMHVHLLSEDAPLVTAGIAERSAQLLQAICVRSVEGRRRVVGEVSATLLIGVPHPTFSAHPSQTPGRAPSASAGSLTSPTAGSHTGPNTGGALERAASTTVMVPELDVSEVALALAPATGVAGAFVSQPGRPAPAKVRAFVALIGSLLASAASQSAAAIDPRRPQPGSNSALSADMTRVMRELGVVRALAAALRQVNPEHPQAAKSLGSILKPLEILTRNLPAWALKKSKQAAAAAAGAPAAGGAAGAAAGGAGTAAAPQAAAGAAGGAEGAAGPSRAGAQGEDTAMGEGGARVEAGPAAAAGGLRGARGAGAEAGAAGPVGAMLDDVDALIDAAMAELPEGGSEDDDEDDEGGEDDEDDDMVRGLCVLLLGWGCVALAGCCGLRAGCCVRAAALLVWYAVCTLFSVSHARARQRRHVRGSVQLATSCCCCDG